MDLHYPNDPAGFDTFIQCGYTFLTTRSSPEQAHQSWLNQNVSNGKYWVAIKTCLIDANVCQGIVSKAKNLQEFQSEKTRYPIQAI